jgi:hypothetical protein
MNMRISRIALLADVPDERGVDVVRPSDKDVLRSRNRGGVLANISSRFAFINSSFKKWT